MLRVVQDGPYRVSLDASHSTYRLEASPFRAGARLLTSARYGASSNWLSASALGHKAKIVSDGVMAAVDLLAQRGTKSFTGKVEVLRQIAAGVMSDADALVPLVTAIRAGGNEIELGALESKLSERLTDARRATDGIKPISFYTWTEELRRIFRQDRSLQGALQSEVARRFAEVIRGDAKLLRSYRRHLKLISRLTAPFAGRTVLEAGEAPSCLFPSSRSAEASLVVSMFGTTPIPPEFQLIDEVVTRLRAGTLDLSPRADAGWYEHEQHALVPLVTPERMPEAAKLSYGKEYQEILVDLFKALLALTRETHAKQLPAVAVGAGGPRERPIFVEPELTVEPLIEFYLRKAKALEFVADLLRTTFGATTLSAVRGLREGGEAKTDILSELSFLISLFRGAASLSAREIAWDGAPVADADIEALQLWRMQSDPDLQIDTRMMLPIFYDRGRRLMKVWCVLGYEVQSLAISYDREPELLGVETVTAIPPPRRSGRSLKQMLDDRNKVLEPMSPPPVRFVPQRAEILLPVMEEVYVENVMNREEFRNFCNQFDTKEDLLERLRVAR